ncbi:Cystathionine gamma-synthase [Coemansia sp. RSA 1804]|nr:Cystathionine gamma-synthase [Coemansia sp. RSA 1804]
MDVPLGECVPPSTPFAVSVSLPTWDDNVGYEKGEQRVLDAMVSGYPRFFIAKPIQALAEHVKDRFALPKETAMLFPSLACAERCTGFIFDQAKKQQKDSVAYGLLARGQVRVVQYVVEPINRKAAAVDAMKNKLDSPVTLYCVMFPEAVFPLAKQYWQHTGNGISARLASYCLHIAQANEKYEREAQPRCSLKAAGAAARNVAAAAAAAAAVAVNGKRHAQSDCAPAQESTTEADAYLEERFGRNFDPIYAGEMKQALRRRIADALARPEKKLDTQVTAEVKPDDVYLLATGMSAIFYAHQALLGMRQGKSVCFGFPYTDTLKILEKFGPGAYFLGCGEEEDYAELERILERHAQGDEEPILSIFTECPSNPLLKTADMPRLRALADKYGTAVVVDETIGSFPNVDVLDWADVVVSSLTKVFSGDSNVMGGSLVLNPALPLYQRLRASVGEVFEDLMWSEDAVFLERNSRDFMKRVPRINDNALAVAELLQASAKVSCVRYPKFVTPENYARIMRPASDAGYGGLLSVEFVGGESASRTFYDHLRCCKGPSLGTNFTLVSPYTILAHFAELDWAAQFGVHSDLVRISVGLEPREELLALFRTALDAIPDH